MDRSVVEAINAKDKEWVNEHGRIITWKGCIYIPKNQELQGEIIMKHHDMILGGYPGQYKTWELIAHDYWWPGIGNDIQQ